VSPRNFYKNGPAAGPPYQERLETREAPLSIAMSRMMVTRLASSHAVPTASDAIRNATATKGLLSTYASRSRSGSVANFERCGGKPCGLREAAKEENGSAAARPFSAPPAKGVFWRIGLSSTPAHVYGAAAKDLNPSLGGMSRFTPR
jgi:hypothetical protein